MADVVLIATAQYDVVVPPAGVVDIPPATYQSPAVREIDVMFVITPLVMATPVTEEVITSPTLPASAESFVAVPNIPPVVGLNAKLVAVAAPRVGVTRDGDVARTRAPLPVWLDAAGT